jgi:hypothetical protein
MGVFEDLTGTDLDNPKLDPISRKGNIGSSPAAVADRQQYGTHDLFQSFPLTPTM